MGCYLSVDFNAVETGCTPRSRARKKERKKQILETIAAEAKIYEVLSRVPGRMCANGSSNAASIFTQQGRKGTNQDAMIVWENFTSGTDTTFCGVFDGHGPYGHLVARKVRDSLPTKLLSYWKAQMQEKDITLNSAFEEEEEEEEEKESGNDDLDLKSYGIFKTWTDSFLRAYNVMDEELRGHSTIDCFCSGTTAVTLLLQGKDLMIGNVGDSRAVLGTTTEGNTVDAVQLTVDLKPNLPKEAERIKQCKGRVFALEDEPEVARVWLPHDDSPGLAMARAFGDFCLKDFGLIAVPDITYHRITNRDRFIVLASDGVWDVLSNKEAVDVVSSAPTKTTAARALVEAAVRAWKLKYPTSKVDDCAVVCLYLNQTPNSCIQYKAENDTIEDNDLTVVQNHIYTPGTSEDCKGQEIPTVDSLVPHGLNDVYSGEFTVEKNNNKSSGQSNNKSFLDSAEKSGEITRDEEENKVAERSNSHTSLADCLNLSTGGDDAHDEWSALEGVTRVNSLLNLPRFRMGGDKRTGKGVNGAVTCCKKM